MIEGNAGIYFFLKTPKRGGTHRYIYLRIIVDGIAMETSTKRKCDITCWDPIAKRMLGDGEEVKVLNQFLDLVLIKVHQYKNELYFAKQNITSKKLIEYAMGRSANQSTILNEFQRHNDEMLALVNKGEYALGTHIRFEISKKHLREFLNYKYGVGDMSFRDLDFEFIRSYEFYLKTIKNIGNNTALKYITNFKKIVLLAIDMEIIEKDPFKRFKMKKSNIAKRPLSKHELYMIENIELKIPRLALVRDIFVFQCYTGLAYIDTYKLSKNDVKTGIDGEKWIVCGRQKTGSQINIPLLPQAIKILDSYQVNVTCLKRNSLLPVLSNQKMNAYLKEIADLCEIDSTLNTHKARRTFASTVTLSNDVPIHIVKEMLGHHSVQQTEKYAVTEEQAISREMLKLKHKLSPAESIHEVSSNQIEKLTRELDQLKTKFSMLLKVTYDGGIL